MYFITVSEMMGAGGEKMARQVAEKLGYSFYGEEELMKSASEKGFLNDIKGLGEKGPGLFEKFFSERPKISLDRLQSIIFEVAKQGSAVFYGRGSQLLLRSFDCALHVLLTGSKEKRVERITESLHIGREVAEKMVEKSDQDKKHFLRFAFDEDWLNPFLYDLVLNTDKLGLDASVKMILEAADSKEIKSCGIDSVRKLGMLSLHRKIEAALIEAGHTAPHFFFEVEDLDTVRLFGVVGTPEEKGSIEALVKGMIGVKKVINELALIKGGAA